MDSLRDLTGVKQGGLQQLSNQVAQGNPSVIAESQIYNNVQGMRPGMGNTMEMRQHQRPMGMGQPGNSLMDEFERSKHNRPMPMPMKQEILNNKMNQLNISNGNKTQTQTQTQSQTHGQTQVGPQAQMQMKSMQAMIGPQAQMMSSYGPPPDMVNFHSRMYDNFVQGIPPNQFMRPPPPQAQAQAQQPQQQQSAQPTESSDKEKTNNDISTNGESEMKDEKTVENELNNLNPSENDKRAINNLLNATQNDAKMQNSQFFNLLRNIRDRPSVIDENANMNEQLANQWNQEFKDWKDDTRLNNANWQSYLQALDPSFNENDLNGVSEVAQAPKNMEYNFEKDNHFINEINKNENEDENENGDKYFEEGLRLMKEGNLNEAILAFEACVKIEATRSEAWRYLGICHADNENENSGIAAFLKCIENDPYDLDALLQLGVSYTNEIDPYRALKYLRNWIGSHADYSILLNNSASAAATTDEKIDELNNGNNNNTWMGSRREHGKIVDLFNKALEINNSDADLHIVLGVLYNITSDYDKAEVHFKKAIQARPKDASLWNKLGATQANGQRCHDAIKAYSRALQLKPNYVRALSNLGISFANQGMHREACQSYLASLQRNPSAESVWDHLTMSLMHMNRSDLVALCDKRDPKLFKNYFRF